MNKRAITPIISVILLLMMSVAVAGIAWFWLQSMTQKVMAQTEAGTDVQLTTLQASLVVQSSTCNTTDATVVLYNPGSTDATVSSLVVDGSVGTTSDGPVTAGNALAIDFTGFTSSTGARTATVNSNVGSVTFSMDCS